MPSAALSTPTASPAEGPAPAPRARRARRVGAAASLAVLSAVLAHASARAQDQATLERTPIVGNRELPKVLTIVPWRKPPPGDAAPRPVGGVLDEALAPIDREVFRRQIAFHAQRRAGLAAAGPAAASPTAAPPAAR